MKKNVKAIRRMGFIRDQQGIMNRYLRESARWKYHLERTRRFISDSFSGAEAETVAVLGSGWLLDVPLEDLCRRFRRVFLVDIHHPLQIRKRTAQMQEVELIETGLTAVGPVFNVVSVNKLVIRAARETATAFSGP